MSCLPSSSPSIHYSSLSIFRARACACLALAWSSPRLTARRGWRHARPSRPPSAEAYTCGALTSCLYGQRGQCCAAIAPCC